MNAWPKGQVPTPSLYGSEGELVLLRITVEPKLLEDLLDALAHLDFPVNPELSHQPARVVVEFPAYETKIQEVRRLLKVYRFDPGALQTGSPLALATGA